jgi:hypothetical protein
MSINPPANGHAGNTYAYAQAATPPIYAQPQAYLIPDDAPTESMLKACCGKTHRLLCPLATIKRDCTHVESKILGLVIVALLIAGVTLWALGQQVGQKKLAFSGKVLAFTSIGSITLWVLFYCCRCCSCIKLKNY